MKDTTDFLNIFESIKNINHHNTILVSLDIKSLYTNIPNHEGIEAAKNYIPANTDIPKRVKIKFLHTILTNNNFTFNDQNYIQLKGCAMGTVCAPNYANLFMGIFEEKFIFPKIENKNLLYLRYIDDIILLWNSTQENLELFIRELNSCRESFKFDYSFSRSKISFLDVMICKNIDGSLSTILHHKETDKRNYLHFQSEHPKHIFKSIPYSQALRVKRICSEESDTKKELHNMKLSFLKRGYLQNELEKQIERASSKQRFNLLKQTAKTKNPLTFVTSYNRTLPHLKKVLTNDWNILQINDTLSQTFDTEPLVSYCRNKNLKDILGKKKLVIIKS